MVCKTRIPPLSIIVAVDIYGGFGKKGKIPWNIPEDMQHFTNTTSGSVCIMGRKTYSDMLEMTLARKKQAGRADEQIVDILPNRTSFVVTRNSSFSSPGATTVSSIRDAIEHLDATDRRNIFILGGYNMFIEALPWVSVVNMTIVKSENGHGCDVFFPINELNRKYKITTAKETKELYFVKYVRK